MAVTYSQNGTIVREVEQPAPDFIMNFSKIKGVYQDNGYNRSYNSGLTYDTVNNILKLGFTMRTSSSFNAFYVFKHRSNGVELYVQNDSSQKISIDYHQVDRKVDTPYEIEINRDVIKIDGVEYSHGYNYQGSYNEFYIGPFCDSTPYTCNDAYLEYITILDRSTGKVLFDKRAASRNKDNQIGLLDTADGTFFTTYLGGVR